eukprot:TRINITY_DN17425_c0_g3_i1.p1 TRINITY_DN17425_c0_g3~~TRINITY_DN17425_c0_g3_i1.p1  ORF type:complete len:248 (+),score=38.09 TRINITY_DN17425_c0_g3_i1:83-826(+)
MGNGDSSLTAAPPGGSVLVLQAADMCPTIAFEHSRPPCVPDVSDGAWRSFEAKVKNCASRMWTEKIIFVIIILCLSILGIYQLIITPKMLGDDGLAVRIFITPVCIFILLSGTLAARAFIVSTNEKLDKEILDACNTLASATGLHVEYRTKWTGFCKPKHARTFRGIAIAPGAAMGVAQAASGTEVVNCIVPPGAGPGSVIQVAMPSGATVQATVPAGKNAGDTFQVSNTIAPATPIVVQAVVVETA